MRASCSETIKMLFGIPAERIARWCGCHVTTSRRWKKYGDPPRVALDMIVLKSTGELSIIDREWRGWKLIDGQLVSPNGDCFTPGDVQAIPFKQALIRHYQDLDKVPHQADWVDSRWRVNEVEAETG